MKRFAIALALAALGAVAAAALAGHEEPRPGDRRPAPAFRRGQRLCLILDYLPAFMYTGEKLAYSFRVAKRRGVEESIAFKVSWFFSQTEKTEKQLAPGVTEGDANRNFSVVRGFLKVPPGAKYLHFKLTSGGKNLGAGMARLVDESEEWPKGSRASWGRMVDAKGLPLILTLAERTPRVDDRWKPIKWLWEKGRSSASNVIIAGPRLASRRNKSYQDLLAGSTEKLKIKELADVSAADQRANPAHGIYRLVELVESEVIPAAKTADLVVLVTPPEDPELATEPRRYRQGLDWLLSRLKRAGSRRVAIVPPLTRKVRARQLAAYEQICRKSAAVYAKKVGARCVDVRQLKDIEYWRPPGALGEVTGKYPNESGQKKLAELIKSAYK